MARHSDFSGLFILAALVGILFIVIKIWDAIQKQIEKRARAISQVIVSSMRAQLEAGNIARERVQQRREEYLTELYGAFQKDFISGRQWLAQFVAEAEKSRDEQISYDLEHKSRPARIAAEEVKKARAEKRGALQQLKFMQYQLQAYKEYFPFLDEYEEAILNERLDFGGGQAADEVLEQADRVILFLSKEEYEKLSTTERNQLAFDRYIGRRKENWEIGRFYERYIGYLYETDGWEVTFFGAIKGFEDLGRDLVCKKDHAIEIVQAKCWASEKTIHEKHVFQLYGSVLCFELESGLPFGTATPVFVSTTKLSEVAVAAAHRLGVVVRSVPLKTDYPMIKCNLNQGDKIYHLPFDQQYDRVKIQHAGEFYAKTVVEAEQMGFRRAKRYFGH